MNKQDIQTVLNALQNSQLFVQASSNINVLEGFGQQLDDADEAIALLRAFLAEPSEAVAWTESAIDEYLSDYSLPGDDGDYTPTDDEKFVIKDAIIGFMSPTPETKNSPRIEDIQQAVARGWCSDRNLLKRMDSDLATDIADQVAALLFTHPASKPEPLPELTDDEIVVLYAGQPQCDADMVEFAREVLAAAREKAK